MLTRLMIALVPTGNSSVFISTKWHTPHPPSRRHLEHSNGEKSLVAVMI